MGINLDFLVMQLPYLQSRTFVQKDTDQPRQDNGHIFHQFETSDPRFYKNILNQNQKI